VFKFFYRFVLLAVFFLLAIFLFFLGQTALKKAFGAEIYSQNSTSTGFSLMFHDRNDVFCRVSSTQAISFTPSVSDYLSNAAIFPVGTNVSVWGFRTSATNTITYANATLLNASDTILEVSSVNTLPTILTTSSNAWVFNFSGTSFLSSANQYKIKFDALQPPNGTPGSGYIQSLATDGSCGGAGAISSNGARFSVNYESTSTPSEFETALLKPVPVLDLDDLVFLNNATTTDFGYWAIWLPLNEAALEALNASSTSMVVEYGRNSSTSFEFSDSRDFVTEWDDGTQWQRFAKTRILIFPPLTSPATWYARVKLKQGSTTISTSPTAQFDVYYSQEIADTFPNSTSTINELNFSCDNTEGVFYQSVCKALLFLFKPSDDSLDKFLDIKDDLIERVPLGYFTAMSDLIEANLDGSSTSTIINASTSEAFSDIFLPIREALDWIIWLVFGFYIIYRVKHLNL